MLQGMLFTHTYQSQPEHIRIIAMFSQSIKDMSDPFNLYNHTHTGTSLKLGSYSSIRVTSAGSRATRYCCAAATNF